MGYANKKDKQAHNRRTAASPEGKEATRKRVAKHRKRKNEEAAKLGVKYTAPDRQKKQELTAYETDALERAVVYWKFKLRNNVELPALIAECPEPILVQAELTVRSL